MKKAVLLDWDGVLCDSLELYRDLYAENCRRYGRTLPAPELEAFRAWYNPRWEENYYEMGFSPEEFQEVLTFSESYLDYSRAGLFPGVAAMLEELSARWPLAIVSTTPSQLIRARLQAEGLDRFFTLFKGGEDRCSEKIEKIRETLGKLGVEGGVMVGDTPLDIEAGRANGLATVGVTYGWCTPGRVRAAAPDRLVENALQLGAAVSHCLTQDSL